jgi:hypothetical protein
VMLRHTILILAGLGFLLGIIVTGSATRKNPIASPLLCGAILAASMFVEMELLIWWGRHLNDYLPGWRWDWLVLSSADALFRGVIYTGLAVCLGIALWDATPLPKFEPGEVEPSSESTS